MTVNKRRHKTMARRYTDQPIPQVSLRKARSISNPPEVWIEAKAEIDAGWPDNEPDSPADREGK
jgi:hypothetical protein